MTERSTLALRTRPSLLALFGALGVQACAADRGCHPRSPELLDAGVSDAPATLTSPSGVELVWVPGGTFIMGSPETEEGRQPDERPHEVTVGPLYVMRTEVTQQLWARVMDGAQPARDRIYRYGDETYSCGTYEGISLVGSTFPVMCVSWYESVAFANRLSVAEGLAPAYTVSGNKVTADWSAPGYRLLTEAEWEHAAVAATGARFAGASSADDVCEAANLSDAEAGARFGLSEGEVFPCSDGEPGLADVGRYRPNELGLHDMTGNVWEWVWDSYAPYPEGPVSDPRPSLAGSGRVIRGGGWPTYPRYARVADRVEEAPEALNHDLGLRLGRAVLPDAPPLSPALDGMSPSR